MSTRVKHARKATERSIYVEETDGSSDEDSEGDEVGRARGGKGKGKGREREDGSDSDEWNGAPAKKRRKGKGKQKGRGKQKQKKEVRVDLLKKMPMDLVVEILSYLLPTELLVLSRVNKTYRALLTSKTAKSIWRTSRRLIEMPDLEANDISEMAYTALVFGKKCDVCDKGVLTRPDFYLRVRLCKDCRKDSFVKLEKLGKTHPHLHPSVAQVVVSTPYTAASGKWESSISRFALQADLEYYSQLLHDLQDEDDADLANFKTAKSPSATRSGRSRRPSASYRDSANDGEGGERVASFVEERAEVIKVTEKASPASVPSSLSQSVLNLLAQDAEIISSNYDTFKNKAASLEGAFWSNIWKQSRTERDAERPEQVVQRQRESDLLNKISGNVGIRVSRIVGTKVWKQSPLVKRPAKLTDEEWEAIEPDILDLAQQAAEEAEQDDAKWREEGEKSSAWRALRNERDEQLKAHYSTLRDASDDDFARAAFPLLSDFYLFSSVKSLRLPEKQEPNFDEDCARLSDEEWEHTLPLIQEEIEQYRLELFLQCVKLVLSATTDDPLPDDYKILDNAGEYDNAFFERASSLLCCDLGCYRSGGRDWWTYTSIPTRYTFLGSLQALLEHQHKVHADHSYWYEREKKKGPRFHFSLPAEVACAMSALFVVGDLDPQQATKTELDELDKRTKRYEWQNTHGKRKRFSSWRQLLDSVYRESQRVAKMKPPRSLEPPCIVWRPRTQRPSFSKGAKKERKGRGLALSSSDEDEDEDGLDENEDEDADDEGGLDEIA
ncbi:hypothetical protein JCM10213_006637 [Rhodosporidiobolus nylandii]